jgi:hypothetical protein
MMVVMLVFAVLAVLAVLAVFVVAVATTFASGRRAAGAPGTAASGRTAA